MRRNVGPVDASGLDRMIRRRVEHFVHDVVSSAAHLLYSITATPASLIHYGGKRCRLMINGIVWEHV